jgi:hypothetical protein
MIMMEQTQYVQTPPARIAAVRQFENLALLIRGIAVLSYLMVATELGRFASVEPSTHPNCWY